MKPDFESLDLGRIRMLSFEMTEIRVVLNDGEAIVFKFPNREQMEAAIERWSTHPEGLNPN